MTDDTKADKWWRKQIERLGTARDAVVQEHKKTGANFGIITCPVCTTGKLSWRRAKSNGHIHASCSTHECVSWME